MKKLKPINILDTEPLRPERAAVLSGIREVILWAGIPVTIPINDYGRWRHPEWRNPSGQLLPYLSVDWYVENASDKESGRLCVEEFLDAILNEPWRDESLLGDHYDFFIIDRDIFTQSVSLERRDIVEVADPELGAIISAARLQPLNVLSYTVLKTAAMRAVAGMFGCPSPDRDDTECRDQVCCTNRCIMGRAAIAPRDWETLSMLRLSGDPICPNCLADIRSFLLDEESSLPESGLA